MSMTEFEKENLSFVFQDRKILLGITGSIAAFKAYDLVRLLKGCGAEVRVVLSQGAENFVTPLTLETLSGFPVLTGFWKPQGEQTQGTHHIDTARWADCILIAPATAHMLAKMAHAFADDLLTTELLAFQGPVWVAPAMNPAMYSHAGVQENISTLKKRGVEFLGPDQGLTACGEEGLGRMLEPIDILREMSRKKTPSLGRKSFLITLGPTRSALDPVRYLTNRSSGYMGAALAWACAQAGHDVTVVCGPHEVALPPGIEVVPVTTNSEMLEAVQKRWPQMDAFLATAAVLDWEIENTSQIKLKREEGAPPFTLKKGPDVLQWVCDTRKSGQFILGFAAETTEPLANGLKKLERKKCDALFVNDVSVTGQGFESLDNRGWWLTSDGPTISLEKMSKNRIARRLLELSQERWI